MDVTSTNVQNNERRDSGGAEGPVPGLMHGWAWCPWFGRRMSETPEGRFAG